MARWESLRRVSHKAIRSKELPTLVNHSVKRMIDQMIDREGTDRPFSPMLFDIEQTELRKFKYISTDFLTDLGNSLYLYEFIPVIRYFMANPLIKYKRYFKELLAYTREIYIKHDKTHDPNNLRDFCDILIAAKHEAIADDKQTAPYFTDDNLPVALIELFSGNFLWKMRTGTETTQTLFQWILLYIAVYPDYQDKLRDEISMEISDRVPVIQDKLILCYNMAFVMEMLRFRNPTPLSLFHKAFVDCKLGPYNIPKSTQVVLHQAGILMNEKYWPEPNQFKPERFLD
ncbi:unnamed protein product, partial [Medioppia subpectinata]